MTDGLYCSNSTAQILPLQKIYIFHNIYDTIGLAIIFYRISQAATSQADGVTLLTGPLELLLDVPFEIGCFQILNSTTFPSPTKLDNLTSASCIVSCLSANPLMRYAGNSYMILALTSFKAAVTII